MNDLLGAARARSFSLPAGDICTLTFGRGQRRVLALHGWLDNAASFAPLAPLLNDACVVALDLAGHGHSDHRPPGTGYHLLDYITDVIGVADALGWRECTLLGHSLGAGLASLVAAAWPERVERLCLLDGIGPISGRAEEAPSRLRRGVDARLAEASRKTRVHPGIDTAVRARLAATRMHEANARLIVERNLRAVEGGFTWRTDGRLTLPSLSYLDEAQVLAHLSAVTCPALLLIADDGAIVTRTSTPARIAAMPSLSVDTLPGHHHVHMDDAATVAERLNRFLDPE